MHYRLSENSYWRCLSCVCATQARNGRHGSRFLDEPARHRCIPFAWFSFWFAVSSFSSALCGNAGRPLLTPWHVETYLRTCSEAPFLGVVGQNGASSVSLGCRGTARNRSPHVHEWAEEGKHRALFAPFQFNTSSIVMRAERSQGQESHPVSCYTHPSVAPHRKSGLSRRQGLTGQHMLGPHDPLANLQSLFFAEKLSHRI